MAAPRSVELKGKRFRIAGKIGAMPLLKFSMLADTDIQDPRALAAMYTLLRDCIDSEAWPAFEDHAMITKADADELMDVVTKVMELLSKDPPKGQPGK